MRLVLGFVSPNEEIMSGIRSPASGRLLFKEDVFKEDVTRRGLLIDAKVIAF